MTVSSDLIADDIDAYLERHANKSMLRFITCGSVDDGKSTLIGRLLYESKLVFDDQLTALEADSRKSGTQGRGSISRSWSTVSPPNVSRASRSTSPTATSRPSDASSSSPILRGTSSTPETW